MGSDKFVPSKRGKWYLWMVLRQFIAFIFEVIRSPFLVFPVIILFFDLFIFCAVGMIFLGDEFWFQFARIAWFPFLGEVPMEGSIHFGKEEIMHNFRSFLFLPGMIIFILKILFPKIIHQIFLWLTERKIIGFLFGFFYLLFVFAFCIIFPQMKDSLNIEIFIFLFFTAFHGIAYISLMIFFGIGRGIEGIYRIEIDESTILKE